MPTETAAPRRYRSQLRELQAAQTKATVVRTATELFLANGWARTGMRDVAAAAGVALETVYSHFSSKRGLLRAVTDAAASGDDVPIALADRPEFRAMGQGRRSVRLRAAASLLTAVQVRTTPLATLLRESASADDEIAEMLRDTRERQREDIAAALELIVGRPPTDAERDGVWAIASPEVYLLLVAGSGWSPEQYEAWMAMTLDGVVART